jgi:Tetracyclin repressor-like, C-terminal domain
VLLIPCLVEAAGRSAEIACLLDRVGADYERSIKQIVARALERGELEADLDIETLVGVIVGPIVCEQIVHRRSITPEYVRAALDIIIAGLSVHARR